MKIEYTKTNTVFGKKPPEYLFQTRLDRADKDKRQKKIPKNDSRQKKKVEKEREEEGSGVKQNGRK